MKMTRSAGIKRRHDGGGPPAPLGVGELVPTQAETHAVVVAVLVPMPNLNEAAAKRLAANVEYEPCDRYSLACGCIRIEIPVQRRVRLEEGAAFPFKGRSVSIVTCGRERQFGNGLRKRLILATSTSGSVRKAVRSARLVEGKAGLPVIVPT